MIRLFVPDDLEEGAAIALAAGQAHYLRDVMRRGIGEAVLLFNGRDGEWRAVVAAADRRGLSLRVQARTQPPAPVADLELVTALVKRPRLETIVEKATELGVRRIRLALTRFTQAERANVARLTAIAVEAAEQTGRLEVPEVIGPEKLDVILDGWEERALIFCDEGGEAASMLRALGGAVTPHPPASEASGMVRGYSLAGSSASILIGPEGGFSPEERARLRALPFVIPVSLGPRILRADTAAIAALTLWQSALGDWAP